MVCKVLSLTLIFSCWLWAFSQTQRPLELTRNPAEVPVLVEEPSGEVTHHMSPELERYIALMDSVDAKTMKVEGYRIQVFSASGPNAKSTAFERQAEFLRFYESVPSYTKWSYPNWVLRVGDFRTRLEALELHEAIKAKYPASFIIKDEIETGR